MKTILFIIGFVFCSEISAQVQLDQNHIGTDTSKSAINEKQIRMQTFMPTISGKLEEIKIEIETGNSPSPIIYKILNGGPEAEPLAIDTVNISGDFDRGWLEIHLADPPTLINLNIYTIVLSSNCINYPGQCVWWFKASNDDYKRGEAYQQFGTTIIPENRKFDFYFQTYMNPELMLVEDLLNEILLVPNPAMDYLQLRNVEKLNNMYFTIYDMDGKIMIGPTRYVSENIDIGGLASGLYNVELSLGEFSVKKKLSIVR